MPKIPKMKTSRMATIRIVLLVRFLRMIESGRLYAALLGFLGCIGGHGRNGRLHDFNLDPVRRQLQLDRIITQRHDGAAHPAGGGDLVADLQVVQHLLPLLLLLLVRPEEQQVKHTHHQDGGQKGDKVGRQPSYENSAKFHEHRDPSSIKVLHPVAPVLEAGAVAAASVREHGKGAGMARQSGAVTGLSNLLPDHSSRLSQTPEAPANRRAQDTQIGRIPKQQASRSLWLVSRDEGVSAQTNCTGSPYGASAWSDVSRTTPSAFACAIRIRSKGSLCSRGSVSTVMACRLDTGTSIYRLSSSPRRSRRTST